MRECRVNLFKVSELSEEAFERAREDYANTISEIPWEGPWECEALTDDSFRAVFDAAGVKLVDYSYGAHIPAHARLEFPEEGAGELSGARAVAWLENNLFGLLRIPWKGKNRWSLSRYGGNYRAGCVKPCPLTGYCVDDALLDALRDLVRSGATLREAFEGLAWTAGKFLSDEWEYMVSPEGFRETAEANEWEYTEEGRAH